MSALDYINSYIKINTLDYGFAVTVKSKEYSETHACESRDSVMQLIRDELYPIAPDGEASIFEERITPPPPPPAQEEATEGSYEFGVGDVVYCKALGSGRVTDHRGSGLTYPLEVTFENDPEPEVYTVDGKWQEDDVMGDDENDFIKDRKLMPAPF